jgi:hypothetical protein
MDLTSQKYIFSGKIIPERTPVNIQKLNGAIINQEGDIICELQTSIINSQISILGTPKKEITDIIELKNDIEDFIRFQVDILGYMTSYALEVDITQMTDLSGNVTIFYTNACDVSKFHNNRPKKFDEIWPLCFDKNGQYLRLCLNDLREAIRKRNDKGFFCYRSIECLRQYFIDKGLDDKNSWDLMKSELNIKRENIDFIKNYADPVRHGRRITFSKEEAEKMLEITWKIIDNYIVYACNGYKKNS